jgi:hypothetical protein
MRRTATEMVAILKKLTLDAKADLVVWQTGTVDAMRGIDPDEFHDTLEAGVAAIRAAGADVILVNMQYSPRTETMIAVQAYADAMHSVAQQQDVPLFDRLAAMKHWNENGTFDLSSRDRSRLAETVHDCLGRTLAALILESGKLDRKQPKEKPRCEMLPGFAPRSFSPHSFSRRSPVPPPHKAPRRPCRPARRRPSSPASTIRCSVPRSGW